LYNSPIANIGRTYVVQNDANLFLINAF